MPDYYAKTVELLSCRETYVDKPKSVQVIETHISCVFVTDRFVYKLKKPVHYEFVDYSTPEARHEACQEEVRLNRRLTRDMYLGIEPIVLDGQGRLRLGSRGRAVDWVVKMRRLPMDQTLRSLIGRGQLTNRQIDQLGSVLANFYVSARPLMVRAPEYRRQIEDHVRANRQELLADAHQLDAALVKRIHSAQLQFLQVSAGEFENRVCDGRIVEGHGDLRPEHVCFEASPVVFDCIEFNAELRQLDVADELCFLAMECDGLGAAEVGRRVLAAYSAASGDEPPPPLLNFYKSYRACVRAKVAALRSQQLRADAAKRDEYAAARAEVRRYLQLADRYVAQFARPLLLVVGGLMGTGKTTLATALAETFGAEVLRTDVLRREMFGAETQPAHYAEGTYTARRRAEVYQELGRRAEGLLERGLSVVLDGTFLSAAACRTAVDLAERHGAQLLFARCHCPGEVARERIAARLAQGTDASEARAELYDQQQADAEPMPPQLPACQIDTSSAIIAGVRTVIEELRARYQ